MGVLDVSKVFFYGSLRQFKLSDFSKEHIIKNAEQLVLKNMELYLFCLRLK